MDIPVYLFTGFLESGKTKFIQETLEDKRFNNGERTLLLLCEEGEEELDPSTFSGKNVFVKVIDDPGQLNVDDLSKMIKDTRSERVVVEYNGMWMLDELYSGMPEEWVIAQTFTFIDASTFETYNANMRQLMYDKLANTDMVVFNRMTDSYDKEELHKAVRTASRSTDIVYEDINGNVSPDDIEDPLPFDIDAPIVEIDDDSYAIWYRDMVEDMAKYDGKTVKVKVVAQPQGKYPSGFFIFGREIMTCCVEDIRFAGLAGKYEKLDELAQNGWYIMTGRIELRFTKLYNKRGPVFYIDSMEPADEPEQPVATFY